MSLNIGAQAPWFVAHARQAPRLLFSAAGGRRRLQSPVADVVGLRNIHAAPEAPENV